MKRRWPSLRLLGGEATMLCVFPGVRVKCSTAHWSEKGGGYWRVSVDAEGVAWTWWAPS